MIKINPSDKIEVIEIRLSKEKTPIAFKSKVDELIEQGLNLSREEVEKYVSNMIFPIEIYYEKGQGLFGIESEALECNGAVDFFPHILVRKCLMKKIAKSIAKLRICYYLC